ncbi:MAG: TPM domain-containing protein [Thermodesulfobacteriota bacterium]
MSLFFRQWRAAVSAALFCLLLLGSSAGFALDVPAYRDYVNDRAAMFRPETVQRLNRQLAEFDRSDSTQIAVLTIPTLAGDDLEQFSLRTAETWGIGRKGRDNGALLLIVRDDRKIRIEVGYGLEGVLTDLFTGRVIDRIMTPAFRSGRFDQGLEEAITAIIGASRGVYSADDVRPRPRGKEPPPLLSYLFFAGVLLLFLGRLSRPLGVIGGMVLLPLVGFIGLPVFSLLIFTLLLSGGALAGLLLPILFGGMARGGPFLHGGFGGGYGGGFRSGGGGGFGGFGGGGFGGGGASGGW